ncbi:hypothetical protein HMPREF9308_01299 [Staphylococcus lugdunensis ACS-027-V-Sch2]|nr:hypothetical protein HMPREF9308_01299 [Staphylococcus lugdunensis ACS-027-V-Sch2]
MNTLIVSLILSVPLNILSNFLYDLLRKESKF